MSTGSSKRPPPDASRPTYPRKRAAQACGTCRRRRVKCDNEQPSCTSCSKLGVQCVYQEGDKSSFDPASLAILQRLDELESLVRVAIPDTTTPQEVDHPSSGKAFQAQEGFSQRDSLSSQEPFINVEAVLEWPILRSFLDTQPLSLANILQAGSAETDVAWNRLLQAPDFDEDATNQLLQNFIDNFHIYNPVIELTHLQEDIRTSLYNGLGWDSSACISLLVFALGTIDCDHDDSVTTSMMSRNSKQFQQAESFFVAAQRRMGQLLCRSGPVEAQIFFLSGVYLMTTMRPFEAWRMFLQALACCQGFVTSSGVAQDKASELHDSIYWTAFKSELELRLEMSITENSAWNLRYPQFFPSPPRGLQSEGEAGWYFYLAEIALRRLSNRILAHSTNVASREASLAEKVSSIVEFEQQAQSWVDSLPASLKLDQPIDHDTQSARLRFILSGHLIDCYEMIYWPLVVDAVHGRLHEDAEATRLARKGLEVNIQRIKDNEPGFRRRHHGTWLMLRSCTRSAFVLVAAGRAGIHSLLPLGWKASINKVMDLLRFWKDEARDAKIRLELLEAFMSPIL